MAHSGTYGAFLGDTQSASLSQAVSTVPGQSYLLSLWLDNPSSGTGQQFIVNWNTNTAAQNPVFRLANPPAFSWTNLQFLVSATGTNSTLQIQAEPPQIIDPIDRATSIINYPILLQSG